MLSFSPLDSEGSIGIQVLETLGVAGVKNTEGSSSLGDGLMSKFVGILDLLAVAGVVFALERDGGVSDSVDLGL